MFVEQSNTNRLLSVEPFDISSDTATCFGRLRPSSDHYYNILKKGKMQYRCIRRTLSLSGITQVYNNHYNINVGNVKTSCKLAGSCKITSLLKMHNGEVKMLI